MTQSELKNRVWWKVTLPELGKPRCFGSFETRSQARDFQKRLGVKVAHVVRMDPCPS
jgi:hypothetical protein